MEEKKIKISILIPVYNAAKTLAACLDSVVSQMGDDCELIVLDNNSTDSTSSIINDFSRRYFFIHPLFLKERGRGRARNACLEAARGEIIVMIDADCIACSSWLTAITAPLISKEALAVSGFEQAATDNYWTRMRQKGDEEFIKTKIESGYINHVDTKNFAILANLLRELGFDADLIAYEDWDLFLRLKQRGVKILFKPEIVVSHYHNASALSLWRTQILRGQEVGKIVVKYKNKPEFQSLLANDISALSLRPRNFLFFFPWALWQFITRPYQAPFVVLSDLAWKIGLIKSYFRRYIH